jgi:hypothetical protein
MGVHGLDLTGMAVCCSQLMTHAQDSSCLIASRVDGTVTVIVLRHPAVTSSYRFCSGAEGGCQHAPAGEIAAAHAAEWLQNAHGATGEPKLPVSAPVTY